LFGLTSKDFEGDLDALFGKVLAKGWVRVRLWDNLVILELINSVRVDKALSNIAWILMKLGVPDNTNIRVDLVDNVNPSSFQRLEKPLASLLTSRFSFLTSSGRYTDDYEGGLWVSPQGKVYEADGGDDGHSGFVAENPSLFGLSEAEQEDFFNFGMEEAADYLLELALSKGWARVRIVNSDIFIDVARSPRTDRFLSRVAQVIMGYGISPDTYAYVEILEEDGHYSNSNECLDSLLTSRFLRSGLLNLQAKWVQGLLTREQAIEELVRTGKSREIANRILDSWGTRFSSYTPLYSDSHRRIISTYGGGFEHANDIAGLKRSVLTYYLNNKLEPSWDVISQDKEDGLVIWHHKFTLGKLSRVITFKEDRTGKLTVLIDNKLIAEVGKSHGFTGSDYLRVLESLRGRSTK